jgi:hypothetical protein
MTSTVSLEGVKKIILFPFQDKKRVNKILIGSALTFANYIVPFIPTIPVMGYAARVMKRIIIEDEDPTLPEWTDWGNLFLDGLKVFGAMILYQLPGMLFMFGGYGVMMIPIFALPTYAYSSSSPDTFVITMMLANFGGMALMMFGMLVALATSLLVPPALGNMIAKENFAAAFRIKEWWPVFKINFAGYLVALALLFGFAMVMIYVTQFLMFTVVLCFLFPFLMGLIGFILNVITLTLYAVAYRDGVRKLAGTEQQ